MRSPFAGVCMKCGHSKPYLYNISKIVSGKRKVVSRQCWECIDPDGGKKKRKVVVKKKAAAAPKKRVIRRVKR